MPARYVNGFYAHEVEEDTLIVRQRDAHAWAECWIDGVGWITADATPSSGLPGQVRDGPGMLRRMWERVQDALSAVRAWLSEMDATRLAMLVVGAAAVALLVAVVRILRRPGRRRRRRDEGYVIPDAALAELARRFERKLGQAGAPCPVNRTWLEHVDALAPAAELDRSACREFCRVYNAARFGGAARDSVAELEKLLERL